MAAKKSTKKSSKKTIVYKKENKAQTRKDKKSRAISFFIGVITVIVLGFLFFQYAQSNNYKQVLGEKTNIEKQTSK